MQKKKHDARTGPEEGATERMFVVVRVRGLTERERQLCSLRYPHRLHAGYKCVECTPTEVIASDPDTPESSDSRRHYAFDRVFDAAATNLDIYNATVRPMLPGLLEGFNATCFAYGMTGAGKTYTMMGADRVKGLCYMAVEDLFPLVRESDGTSAVHASYLEIYNEKIKDLLGNDEDRRHDIIEDPVRGVVVTELAEYRVSTLQDLYTLMALGCEKRTRASTVSNVVSSRSHAILLITVKRERGKLGLDAGGGGAAGASKQVSVGKLALIDLAGSERALPGESKRGDRLREGANINRSLLALGNCITILGSAKAGEKRHVPYRDSKLTRLLKDALGGNTRTVMIGNTSPSSTCYEEVISTLKYATRARSITRCVTRNALVVPDKLAKGAEHPLLETIRADIEQLQTRLIMRTCERDGICHPRPLLSPATRFTPHPVLSSRKPPTAADPPAGTASRAADSNPESTKQRSATSPADVPLVSAPRPGQASRHRHPSASLQLQLQLPPGGAGGASGRSDSKMRRSATAPAGAQLSAEPAGVQADGRQPGGVSPRAAGPHPGHYPANAQPSGAPGVQAEVQHHLQPAVASGVSLRAAGSHPVHSAANVQLVGITGVQAEVQQLLQPASGKLAASAGPHPVLDSPAAVPRVRRRSGGLDTDDDDDDGGSGGEGGSDGSPASTKRGGGGAAANRDDAPSKAAAAAGGGGRCERPGADDYGESCSNRVSTKRGGGGGAAAKREAEDTPPEPGLAAPAAAGGRGAEYDDGDSGCSSRVSTQQGGDTSGRGSRQPPSPAGSNSSSEASRSTAHTQVPGTGRGGAAAAANTLSGNPGSSPFRPDCAAGADRGTPAEAAAGVAATAGAAADTRVLPLAFSPVGGHHGSSPFRSSCAADAGRGTPTEAAAGVAATTADTRALPLAFSPAGGNPGSSPFRPNFADGGTEAAGVVAAALPLRGSPPPRPKGAARSLTAPAARSQRGAADPVSCALGPAILRCRAAASHLAGVASSAAGSPCLTPQETAPGGSPCLGPQAAAPSGSPWLAPQETAPGGSPCLTPQETAPGGSPCLGPQAAAPGGSPCLTPQETAPGGSPCLGPQAAAPSGSTWLAPQETAPGGSPCLAPQAAAAAKGSSQLVDTTLEPHRESSHISLDQLSSETREYPNRRDEGPVGSPGHGPANNLENEREIERTNSVDKHGPGSVGFPDGVPAGCRVEYLEIDIQAEMECINHQPTEPVCPPRGRVRDGAGRGKANGFPPPNRDQSYESNADAHGSRETGADAFSTQLCEGAWMHGLDRLQDGVGRGYANVFPPPTDQSYEGDEARADAFSKHLQAARPQGLDRLRDDMGRGSVNVFNPQPRDQPYGSDDDAQCSRETGTDASSTHVHQGTRPQGLDRQQDDVRRGSVNVFHPPPRDQQSDDDTQCSREPGADAFATHPQEEARPQGLDGLRADAGRGSVNVFPPPTEQLYEINADAHSAPPSGKVQPQRRDDIARREAECALPGDQSYESSAPEDVQPQHAWRQVDREAHVDSFLLHEEAHLSHAAIQLHAQEPWCEEASYNASERTHLNGFSRKGGASHANVRRQPEDENPAVRGDDDPQLSRGSRRLREAVPLARRDQRERTEVPHHHQLDEDDGSYGLAAALSYEGQPAEPLQTASTHGGGGPSSPCNPTAPAAATATGDPPRLDLVGNLLRLPLALRDKSRACGSADGAPPYPAAAPKDREMQRLKEVLVRFGKSVGDVGDADTPSDWSDVREHADAGLDGSQRLRDRVPAAEAYSSLGAVACAPSPRARRRAHTCRPPPPLPSPGAWGTQSCNQPAKSPTLFPYSSRPRDTDASVDSALGWVKATSPRTRHLDATCELIDAPHAPEDSAGSAGPRGANGGTRLGGFPQGEGGAAPPPGAPRGGAVEGSRQRASSAPGCSGSERLLLRLRGAAARPGGRHGARRGCAGQAQGQPASEPPGKRPRHPQALRQQQQQQLVLLPQGGQQRAGRPQPGRQPQPLQQQREPERPEHRSQPQQQLGVQLQQQQRHLTCAQKQQQQQQQEPERPEHRSQPQQQLGVQQQQQHPTCAQKQQQQEPERPEHRSQPQQQLGVQQQQQQQRRLTRAQKQQQEPERPEHRNQPQQLLGGQQWAGRRQPGPQPQQQQQQPLLQEPKRLQHRNQPQQLAQQRAGRQQSVQQPQFHQQQQQQQEPERPQPHSQLQPQRHAARQLLQQQQQQRKRPQNQHPLQPYLERLQLRQQREQEQQGLQRQPHPRRQPPSQQQQPKARERRPTPTQSQRQGDLPLDVQQQPHLSDQLSLQQQQQPQARERHQMQVQRQGDHLQNVQQPHLSDQLSLQQQQQPKARERCQTPTQPQQRQEDLLHHVQHPHDSGQPEQRGGREQCQRELQKGQPPACRPRDGREHEQHAERLPHRDQGEGQAPEELQQHTAHRLPHRDQLTRRPDHRQQGEGPTPEELQQHTAQRVPHRDQVQSPHQAHRPDHRQQGEGQAPEELQQHATQRFIHQDQLAHQPESRQQGEAQQDRVRQQPQVPQNGWQVQPHPEREADARRFQGGVRHEPPHEHVHRHLQQQPQPGERWDWHQPSQPARAAGRSESPSDIPRALGSAFGNVLRRSAQQLPAGSGSRRRHQHHQEGWRTLPHDDPAFHDDESTLTLSCAASPSERGCASAEVSSSAGAKEPAAAHTAFTVSPKVSPQGFDDGCGDPHAERDPDGRFPAPHGHSAGAKKPAAADTAFTVTPRHPGSPTAPPQGFDEGCGDPHAERDPDARWRVSPGGFPAPHGPSAGGEGQPVGDGQGSAGFEADGVSDGAHVVDLSHSTLAADDGPFIGGFVRRFGSDADGASAAGELQDLSRETAADGRDRPFFAASSQADSFEGRSQAGDANPGAAGTRREISARAGELQDLGQETAVDCRDRPFFAASLQADSFEGRSQAGDANPAESGAGTAGIRRKSARAGELQDPSQDCQDRPFFAASSQADSFEGRSQAGDDNPAESGAGAAGVRRKSARQAMEDLDDEARTLINRMVSRMPAVTSSRAKQRPAALLLPAEQPRTPEQPVTVPLPREYCELSACFDGAADDLRPWMPRRRDSLAESTNHISRVVSGMPAAFPCHTDSIPIASQAGCPAGVSAPAESHASLHAQSTANDPQSKAQRRDSLAESTNHISRVVSGMPAAFSCHTDPTAGAGKFEAARLAAAEAESHASLHAQSTANDPRQNVSRRRDSFAEPTNCLVSRPAEQRPAEWSDPGLKTTTAPVPAEHAKSPAPSRRAAAEDQQQQSGWPTRKDNLAAGPGDYRIPRGSGGGAACPVDSCVAKAPATRAVAGSWRNAGHSALPDPAVADSRGVIAACRTGLPPPNTVHAADQQPSHPSGARDAPAAAATGGGKWRRSKQVLGSIDTNRPHLCHDKPGAQSGNLRVLRSIAAQTSARAPLRRVIDDPSALGLQLRSHSAE